jgi:hypothetical protein
MMPAWMYRAVVDVFKGTATLRLANSDLSKFKKLKKKTEITTLKPAPNFFLARTAEGGGRILVGDNTGRGAVTLRLI